PEQGGAHGSADRGRRARRVPLLAAQPPLNDCSKNGAPMGAGDAAARFAHPKVTKTDNVQTAVGAPLSIHFMNIIIPQFDPAEHFGQGCQFWNSIDDWFLQRDLIKTHRYSDSLCITDLADAMKPGKICEEFSLRWNRVEGIPPFVHDH